LRYGIALLLCLAALSLRLAIVSYLPAGYPFVSFFPAVILTTFLFGPRTGSFAGIMCGVFSWYFFVAPSSSFSFNREAAVALGFYAGVVTVDIALVHWMQAANARLRAAREEGRRLAVESAHLAARSTALAERGELLFQELQHRVGNNLQMVGAVLSLQLRTLEEPTARRAISDAVARIQVIGSIQRQLYRKDGELVPLETFVSELCDQLMSSNGRPGVTCTVEASCGLVLPPDAAVPVALVLSEAIANALEHAFVDRPDGTIRVSVFEVEQRVILQVRDDGAGLPEGFDASRSESLGLRISRVLSRQLDAEYSLAPGMPGAPGCTMRLSLPIERLAPKP